MKKLKRINITFKKQKKRRLSSFKKHRGGNKKNIALIFYGRVSSYESSIEYLNSIFRNPAFNCKVFCSLNLKKTNNYIKELCNIFEIGDEQINIEPTVLAQNYIDMNKELCKDISYSCYSSYSSFYHQNKAFNLVEQYKNKNNINFEVVIVLRADLNPSNNAPKVFLINDNINTFDKIYSHLLNTYNNNYIFLCDSNKFKKYIINKNECLSNKNIITIDIDICHIGKSKDIKMLKNTLSELYIISNSKKIDSYSVYEWISGFVFHISNLYDIPINGNINVKF